jgi:hypothetical protein
MWDAVTDLVIPMDKLPTVLIAEPFPVEFDAIVAREVTLMRIAAGL